MDHNLSKEKGMTLIEVLAALVLVSVVVTLLIGIIVNSQNNFNRQETKNMNTVDITVLLKNITSDIRKTPESVLISSDELKIALDSDAPVIYNFDSDTNTLFRNGNVVANNINEFNLKLQDDVLTLSIVNSDSEVWEIKSVLRRGTN